MRDNDLIDYVLMSGLGFGKTEIILNGANNVPNSTVIVSTMRQAEDLKKRAPNVRFVTVNALPKLIGTDHPAVFDHFAYLDLWKRREIAHRENIESLMLKIETLEKLKGINE